MPILNNENALKSKIGSYVGKICRDAGRLADACRIFKRARALDASNHEPPLALGELYLSTQDWRQARLYFEEALKINPRLPEAHFHLGRIYHRLGWRKSAVRSLHTAIRLAPAAGKYYFRLGEICLDAGAAPQARAHLTEALRLGYRDDLILRMLFISSFMSRRYREAMRRADEIILSGKASFQDLGAVSFPTTFPSISKNQSFSKNQMLRQLLFFEKLSRRYNTALWPRLWKIHLLFWLGEDTRCRKEMKMLERPLEQYGKRAGWMLFLLGYFYLQLGEWRKAVHYLEKAHLPGIDSAWRVRGHLAEAYLGLSNIPAAFKQFSLINARISPDQKGNMLAWRGELRIWLGQYDRAEPDLKTSIKHGSDYGHGWLGALYLRKGHFRKALFHLNKQIEKNPIEAESVCLRGETYRMLKKKELALKDLNACLHWGPWSLLNRCLIHFERRNIVQMRKDFERLLKSYPHLLPPSEGQRLHPKATPPREIAKTIQRTLSSFGSYRRAEAYPLNIMAALGKPLKSVRLPIFPTAIVSGKYQIKSRLD